MEGNAQCLILALAEAKGVGERGYMKERILQNKHQSVRAVVQGKLTV